MDEPIVDGPIWGLVELMGHRKIAGQLSEETLFGTTLLRVDVPAIEGQPEFTRLFSPTAIYSISETTQYLAREAAVHFDDESFRARWPDWRHPSQWPRRGQAVLVTILDNEGEPLVELGEYNRVSHAWMLVGGDEPAAVLAWMPTPPPYRRQQI